MIFLKMSKKCPCCFLFILAIVYMTNDLLLWMHMRKSSKPFTSICATDCTKGNSVAHIYKEILTEYIKDTKDNC